MAERDELDEAEKLYDQAYRDEQGYCTCRRESYSDACRGCDPDSDTEDPFRNKEAELRDLFPGEAYEDFADAKDCAKWERTNRQARASDAILAARARSSARALTIFENGQDPRSAGPPAPRLLGLGTRPKKVPIKGGCWVGPIQGYSQWNELGQ